MNELLGTYEPMPNERLFAIRDMADEDESVIPLLCQTWGLGRHPFVLVRNQAVWFAGICWLVFLFYFFGPTNRIAFSEANQPWTYACVITLGLFAVSNFSLACMEVIFAQFRAANAERIIGLVDNPDKLGVLLFHCYWKNSGDDEILVRPAVLAAARLINERDDFTLHISDKPIVDTVRRLLSRRIDMHSKRTLVLRLLSVIGRDEVVEFLPEVRDLCKFSGDTEVRYAAKKCLVQLEEVAERRRLEFTLLRAVDQLADGANLLRPVARGKCSDEHLLVTVEKGE